MNHRMSEATQTRFLAAQPAAKKRRPRRWLSEDQKPYCCGIGGCMRAYGSASSLCAHKRAHHPGWKARALHAYNVICPAAKLSVGRILRTQC